MKVILYTLNECGICHVIKQKLTSKNINFQELNLEDYIEILKTDHAPVLQVEDKFIYSPTEIIHWIGAQ